MNLNMFCPINTVSYGYVSSYFMRELSKLGFDIRHLPIGQTTPDELIYPEIKDILARRDFHYNAPCLKIWHQNDLSGFTGSPKIGFPIFELEQFKDEELHSLNYPDEIIVCSEWARGVLEKNNIAPDISVVPLGYDDTIFTRCNLPSPERTIFANFGKFEIRKGHDILIDAFNAAFEKDDDVVLVMMPHNFFLTKQQYTEWTDKYKKSKLGDKVELIPRLKTHSMVYNIMEQVHCGVFPARAEGWNLEALELLASGRYLIITNCTGHTEFCNSDNSMLIEMNSGYEKAYDGVFFDGRFDWPKISQDEFDQLVNHMRDVHNKNKSGDLKINDCNVGHLTWSESAKKLSEIINAYCF